MELIETQKQLDTEIKNGNNDFFVGLNGGLRSSKYIELNNDTYFIIHEIDGSEETIKHSELMDSYIGEVITKKAFFKY